MMLPFEAPTIFEGIHKQYFQMPRVVKDQRNKFENDDLFRQLSHESAVKYTGFKDRPLEERQMKFIANCQEGHTEVSVVQSGIQFTLMFNPTANPAYNNEGCDFDKDIGKVSGRKKMHTNTHVHTHTQREENYFFSSIFLFLSYMQYRSCFQKSSFIVC